MVELRDFLMSYIDKPMQWGVDDCSLLIADWWLTNHGVDPARSLRGAYSDETGKATIVEAAGGLVPLVAGIAASVGAEQCAANKDGDFAVLALPSHTASCGIRCGRFWAVRSETGIAYTSQARVIRGWAI